MSGTISTQQFGVTPQYTAGQPVQNKVVSDEGGNVHSNDGFAASPQQDVTPLRMAANGVLIAGPEKSSFQQIAMTVTPEKLADQSWQSSIHALAGSGFQVAITVKGLENPQSDSRLEHLEGRTAQVEQRQNDLEQRFGTIQEKINTASQPTLPTNYPTHVSSD